MSIMDLLQNRSVYLAFITFAIILSLLNCTSTHPKLALDLKRNFEDLRKLKQTYQVSSVVFSPDGTKIISGSLDGSVRIWDEQTGELKHVLRHGDMVRSIALSPDGTIVASGGNDKTVKIWNIQTGDLRRTLIHSDRVTAVAFSPDGLTVAGGGDDDTISLWNIQTGELKQTLTEYDIGVGGLRRIFSVAFSPDGTTVAKASNKDWVVLWDALTGKLKQRLNGDAESIAFSPDGTLLVGAGSETRMWDVNTGKLKEKLDRAEPPLDFSADGRTMASSGTVSVESKGYVSAIKLWVISWRTQGFGILKQTMPLISDEWVKPSGEVEDRHLGYLGNAGRVRSIAFPKNGRLLASGDDNNSIKLWDVNTGRLLITLQILPTSVTNNDPANWIAFTTEGYYIGSNGASQFVVWKVEDKVISSETYASKFHRPDLVQKVLREQ